MDRPFRVLVTGASGFIGAHVARRFAAAGAEVFALVRPPSCRVRLPGVTVVPADLSRREGLGFLHRVPAPDVVCHLAADTRMGASAEEMEANVAGAANLVAALGPALAGKRVLFASSISAVDRASRPKGPLTEASPCVPRSAYAKSKLRGEEVLRAEAKARGFSLAVLRLSTIYGPGQPRGGVVALAEAVRKGGLAARLPWPGRISFCYVGDVAEVFLRLAAGPEAPDGTWFVAEEQGHTMAEAAAGIREAVGGGKGPVPFPRFALRFAGALLYLPVLRRFAPWSLRAALCDTILCDPSALTARLGMSWTPLAEGLRRTFA